MSDEIKVKQPKIKDWEYHLKPKEDQWAENEFIKRDSNGLLGNMKEEYADESVPNVSKETEIIGKCYGIHVQFNRAKTGAEKDWMYMIRLNNPGGGPIRKEQWAKLDELSEKYTKDPDGNTSIRLTTRQAIQLYWLNKKELFEVIKHMAEVGLKSLNGSGDNMRNVVACPFSRVGGVFDPTEMGKDMAEHFELPNDAFVSIFAIDPETVKNPRKPGEKVSEKTGRFDYGKRLLNKCKIGISGAFKNPETGEVVADNGVEVRINELGVAPVIEKNGSIEKFQIYIGGGQGERNGKPTVATLGQPFCQAKKENVLAVLDAITRVNKEYCDRSQRQYLRMKYLVFTQGLKWFWEETQKLLDFDLLPADPNHDVGARHLHHGWTKQADGDWTYGMFLESGRIKDNSPNGKLKKLVRKLMDTFDPELMVTTNQDLLFMNIKEEEKGKFEKTLTEYKYGTRNGKKYSILRKHSGSCVGMPTCRLTYTDSEKFEPELIDQLEEMGWGDTKEAIGVTGCERQCFRPATKSIGLVGAGMNFYWLKLMGSEDARHQGIPLIDPDDDTKMYLRFIPRNRVAKVINALFTYHQENKKDGEDLGAFHRRIGLRGVIDMLRKHPDVEDLMARGTSTDCFIVPKEIEELAEKSSL